MKLKDRFGYISPVVKDKTNDTYYKQSDNDVIEL